jgi:hypothetical protein
MVGGTIRRKLIHRESFRASVLHHSEIHAVPKSIAELNCLLTTPSLLSRGTRQTSAYLTRAYLVSHLQCCWCDWLRLAAKV